MLAITESSRVIDTPQVVVKPITVEIDAGDTQQFSASVYGSEVRGVVWACTGEGSIDSNSGLYTAPTAVTYPSGSATIIASLSDWSVSGFANVVIDDPMDDAWYATVYSNIYQYYRQMGGRSRFAGTRNTAVERETYTDPTVVTAWIGGPDEVGVFEDSVVASEFVEFYFGDFPITGFVLQYTLEDVGTCTHNGATVTKATGANTWDSGAYSQEGWADACLLSFRFSQTDKALGVGLDSGVDRSGATTNIDYMFYTTDAGVPAIYESGALIWTGSSYTTDTVFSIIYDGTNVKYYQGNTLVQTTARAIGAPLHLCSAFYTVGGAIDHLRFDPGAETWSSVDSYLAFDGYRAFYNAFGTDRRAAHVGYPTNSCVTPETICFDINTGYGIRTKHITVVWTRAEILCKTSIVEIDGTLRVEPDGRYALEFLTRDADIDLGYNLLETCRDEITGHSDKGDEFSTYLTVLSPTGSSMVYGGSASDMQLNEVSGLAAVGYFTADIVSGAVGCTVCGGFQMPTNDGKIGILFGLSDAPSLTDKAYFVGVHMVSGAPTETVYGVIYEVESGACTTLVHVTSSLSLYSVAQGLPLKIVREGQKFSLYYDSDNSHTYPTAVFEDINVGCEFLKFDASHSRIGFMSAGMLGGLLTRSDFARCNNPLVVYDHQVNGSDRTTYGSADLTVTVVSGSSTWSDDTFLSDSYTPELRYDIVNVKVNPVSDPGFIEKNYNIYYGLRVDGISPSSGYVGDTVTVSGGYFTTNMLIVLNGTTLVSGYSVAPDKKTLTFTMPDVTMGTTTVGYAGTVTIGIMYYKYTDAEGRDYYLTKQLSDTFTLYRGA